MSVLLSLFSKVLQNIQNYKRLRHVFFSVWTFRKRPEGSKLPMYVYLPLFWGLQKIQTIVLKWDVRIPLSRIVNPLRSYNQESMPILFCSEDFIDLEITLERIHVYVLLSKVRKVFESCTYHSTKIYVRLWLFVRVSRKASKCQIISCVVAMAVCFCPVSQNLKGYNSSNVAAHFCSKRLTRFEGCKNTKLATSCFSISVQSLQRDPKSHPCSYNVWLCLKSLNIYIYIY